MMPGFQELRVFLSLTLIVAAGVSPAAGQVAPDPLPAYNTLPKHPHRVVTTVADEIGKRITLEDGVGLTEVYIWDIAYVQLPDGSVTTLRYEYQTDDGQHIFHKRSLDDFPLGTVEVTDLEQIKPATLIEYTDEKGVLAAIPEDHLHSIGGAVLDGEIIYVPPGHGGPSAGCWGVVKLTCGGDCLVVDPVTRELTPGTCQLSFGSCRCTAGLNLCSLKREFGCRANLFCRRACQGPLPCECIPWP